MNILSWLLYAQLVLIFSVDFILRHVDGAPRTLQLFSDAFVALIFVAAVFNASAKSALLIPAKYVVILLIMVMLFAVGVVFNEVQPGAIFYGMRKYFRYAPLLLLPILVDFPMKERIRHLWFFLFCASWQLPAVLYQWDLSQFGRYNTSGDTMIGTLTTSGVLTIFCLATTLVWTAFFAKKRINALLYMGVLPILVLPTFMNETSSTLVLLPLAIGLPFLMLRSPGSGLRKVLSITILTGILLPGFIWFYSANFERWGGDVTQILTKEGSAYLYRGADADSRADGGRESSEIGRVDSIIMPFLVQKEPINWLIGVGIGNASSVSRDAFAGEFAEVNRRYGIDMTTYGALIWEMGLFGLGLCLLFLYMAYRDARQLSLEEGPHGAIGLAVAALVPFMLVSMAYKNVVFALPIGVGISLLIGNVIAFKTQVQIRTEKQLAETLEARFIGSGSSQATI